MKERLIELGHGIFELRRALAACEAEFDALSGAAPSEDPGDEEPVDAVLLEDEPEPEPEYAPWPTRLLELLAANAEVYVCVDARHPDVVVPAHHKTDPRLVLRFGYAIGIPDLAVDASGVVGTLSFGGVGHRCYLPWTAIGGFWTEDDATVLGAAVVPATERRLVSVPMPEGAHTPTWVSPTDAPALYVVPDPDDDGAA